MTHHSPISMRRRSSYSMSAFFLLVTVVAVLVAVVSAGISEWLKSVPPESFAVPLAIGAAFNGLLGPIVMAYQTSNWATMLLSYFVGTAIGAVAMRLLIGPNNLAVAAAGSAILVAYAIVIRLLQPRPESDAPTPAQSASEAFGNAIPR